jgi:hypothetical protein
MYLEECGRNRSWSVLRWLTIPTRDWRETAKSHDLDISDLWVGNRTRDLPETRQCKPLNRQVPTSTHNFTFSHSTVGGKWYRSWFRHYATSWKVTGSIPDEVIWFFNWSNPSSRTTALGLTQPLTEMNIRNRPEGKGRPAHKANNLTAICEPTV